MTKLLTFLPDHRIRPDPRGDRGRADQLLRHLPLRGHRHAELLRPHAVRQHDGHR